MALVVDEFGSILGLYVEDILSRLLAKFR